MLRRKLLLSMAAFFLMCSSLVVSVEAASMWSKTYGGTGYEVAYSVVATSDGGFAICGAADTYGTWDFDIWLIKTDSTGTVQWNRTYGGPGTNMPYSFIEAPDGGFVITGIIYPVSGGDREDAWLIKTDALGNVEWNGTYGGASHDGFCSILATPDSGYILGGYTTLVNEDTPSWSWNATLDLWLVKTDQFGNMEWNKTYDMGDGHDFARSLIATSDGGYALAGSGLFKTDANGNMQWNKSYSTRSYFPPDFFLTYGGPFCSIVATADGGYATCGNNEPNPGGFGSGTSDFWLVKTDALGNFQWNKTYGRAGEDDYAYSLVQTPDGGYAVAGTLNLIPSMSLEDPSAPSYLGDAWLIKTDAVGNVVWNQTYGAAGVDEAYSLVASSDGGFILAGSKGNAGWGVYPDFWLIKTDEFGVVPELPSSLLILMVPLLAATLFIRKNLLKRK